MMQLLQDTPLSKEQQTYLNNGIASASILLTLINDVLDFSKIEAGLLDIDEYDFDLYLIFCVLCKWSKKKVKMQEGSGEERR